MLSASKPLPSRNARVRTPDGLGTVQYRTPDGWVAVRVDGELVTHEWQASQVEVVATISLADLDAAHAAYMAELDAADEADRMAAAMVEEVRP